MFPYFEKNVSKIIFTKKIIPDQSRGFICFVQLSQPYHPYPLQHFARTTDVTNTGPIGATPSINTVVLNNLSLYICVYMRV